MHNIGSRTVTAVVPRVQFEGGRTLLGSAVEELAPGQKAWSRIKGNAGKAVNGDFTLTLHRAAW